MDAPISTAPDTNDVGIFVTDIAIGYQEPDNAEVHRIEVALRSLQDPVPVSFIGDLIAIKLLVPNQDLQALQIYNIPQAIQFIRQLKEQVVRNYYLQEQ